MTLEPNLRGKYYFIAGAYGGIGGLLARNLKAQGARVFLAGREPNALEAISQELEAESALIEGAQFGSYDQAFDKAATGGKLDGAICCTGSILLKSAHTTTQSEYEATMAANITSAFGMLRAAAKAMMDSGGSIVLMSSVAAKVGLQNHEAISAAKGAILGLTQSAAATYAKNQIRVNCLCPGLVETPLTARLTASELSRKASEAMHPLGRIGTAAELVSLILWLLSDQAGWVTGQSWGIDGGLGALRTKNPGK